MGSDNGGGATEGRVVATKVAIPRLRVEHVARHDLERAIEDANTPLVLVSAPAGYGKTTFLSAWARRTRASVGWVSLDPGDREPIRFWSCVLAALDRCDPDMAQRSLRALRTGASIEQVVVPELLDALAGVEKTFLVLDDYHEVSSPGLDAGLRLFLRALPANVTIVVATRHDPLFALTRLRASGQLVEIRQRDLRFDVDETASWFKELLDIDVSDPCTVALVERTEGWPALLYLSALLLRESDDPNLTARAIVASPQILVEYLRDETLVAWPEHLRTMLRRASPLRRFSAALLEEALRWPDAADDLRELARRNLMVSSTGLDGSWFQLHQLLSETLRMELNALEPDGERQTLSAAARWHADNGDHADAIDYAIQAGDLELAAGLINASWIPLSLEGQDDVIRSFIDRLPPAVIDSDVRLLVTRAWVGVRRAEWGVVERSLDRALEIDPDAPLAFGSTVEADAAIIRGTHPYQGTDAMRANARRIHDLVPPGSPWSVMGQAGLSMADYYDGDLAAARKRLEAVVDRMEPPSLLAASFAWLALMAIDDGDTVAAELALENAESVLHDHGLSDDWLTVLVHTARGEILRRKDRVDDALDELEQGAVPCGNIYSPDHFESVFRLARAKLEAGRLAGIDLLLREIRLICRAWGAVGDRFLSVLPITPEGLSEGQSHLERLTSAELRVYEKLVSTHLTQPQISEALFLSSNTVKSHVRSIYAKLGVRSRAEAAEAAAQHRSASRRSPALPDVDGSGARQTTPAG